MNILRRILRISRGLVQVTTSLARGAHPFDATSSTASQSPVPVSSSGGAVRVRAKAQHVHKWEEKRWVRRSGLLQGGVPANEYSGFYRTAGGRKWQGIIVESQRGVTPYMFNPPLEDIRKHTVHTQCFRPRGDGLYFVHQDSPPCSVDEAIVNIEAFLNELESAARWPKSATRPIVRAVARRGGTR